ncbi:unnamed protein product [Lactuca saligna]|uniref:RNA polymerase II subunit B1 CTD phosphatase RPAP2 homolog n=1 Tax=Lactuca saligna TaxID=75948 RepID=A0AA35V006_LACSI|nr:unnamed protein product [Lactuca saligna]
MSNISSSSSPVAMKDVVHKLQLCLLEGIKSETQLFVAGSLLSKSDYHDVVTERSIAQMCGYPLCPNSLPSPGEAAVKGRYHISLKEHKVYDLLEMRMYCSTKCVVDSRAYAESLQDERSLVIDTAKINKVVRLFDGLSVKAEEGLEDSGDFGLRNLSIKEKEDGAVGGGIVSLEEWIGPSNAIEGYIPQHERSSKNKPGRPKREEESIFGEMDFMSTIITQGDGYSISKGKEAETKTSSSSRKKMSHNNNKDKMKTSSSCNVQKKKVTTSNDEESENGNKAKIGSSEPSCSVGGLKSSLKSSSRTNRSVSWADDQTLCEFSGNDPDPEHEHKFRVASAEACAAALSQAAEAVASGESDAPDAVSEAGIVILPPPGDGAEAEAEAEPARLKWPKKTGITESDFFDSFEDSWFDAPPEEFVLDLSPFARMFMSLFAWVSSSTLAYVYGGCLSRALPGLVHHLRLPTPVSTIESMMGCLLDTMSFIDALPPLRMKQWQVFVLLFVDALSVSRIPAMTPHLANKRRFFQKVFDDAQISSEEYELLKDLIIPLGRAPQLATQSGG